MNCVRCNRQVYVVEKVIGPGGNAYHKSCLTCLECNKRLDSTTLTEREVEPGKKEAYCKTCYARLYGPKGYGYGAGAGTLSTDDTVSAVPPVTKSASSGSISDITPKPSQIKKTTSGNNISTSSDVCPTCSKKVYFAEQVIGPGGVKYHKLCMKCVECKKSLDSTTMAPTADNTPYCKSCYNKLFGPKGFGYGGTMALTR